MTEDIFQFPDLVVNPHARAAMLDSWNDGYRVIVRPGEIEPRKVEAWLILNGLPYHQVRERSPR